jgi:hypothetical protein
MPRSYAAQRLRFITSEVIAARRGRRDDGAIMTPNKLLQLNAAITAVSAVAMLLARPYLYPLFGLTSPLWLDVATAVFIVYAVGLVVAANRPIVQRAALVAFTIGDSLCFLAGLVLLVAFWSDFTPLGRVLIAMTTVVVDVFAMAQFRAAKAAAQNHKLASSRDHQISA